MTGCASHAGVRTGQWEACLAVIEDCIRPGCGSVTDRAIRREASLHVIRIRGFVEIRDVARSTVLRRSRVLSINVATGARHGNVSTGQREGRERVVIESRRRPRRSRMTSLAGRGERCRHMVRSLRRGVVLHVTTGARGVERCVLPAHVTGTAIDLGMRAGQRKLREVVIERSGLPGARRVTHLAGSWHAGRHMIRAGGLVVILQVTARAIRARPLVLASDVASRAFQCRVRACQSEPCELSVIEARGEPGIHALVAGDAVGRKAQCFVVRGGRLLVHGRVTGIAVCRESAELPDGRALMARIAIESRVGTEQREAIEVFAGGLQ